LQVPPPPAPRQCSKQHRLQNVLALVSCPLFFGVFSGVVQNSREGNDPSSGPLLFCRFFAGFSPPPCRSDVVFVCFGGFWSGCVLFVFAVKLNHREGNLLELLFCLRLPSKSPYHYRLAHRFWPSAVCPVFRLYIVTCRFFLSSILLWSCPLLYECGGFVGGFVGFFLILERS